MCVGEDTSANRREESLQQEREPVAAKLTPNCRPGQAGAQPRWGAAPTLHQDTTYAVPNAADTDARTRGKDTDARLSAVSANRVALSYYAV